MQNSYRGPLLMVFGYLLGGDGALGVVLGAVLGDDAELLARVEQLLGKLTAVCRMVAVE